MKEALNYSMVRLENRRILLLSILVVLLLLFLGAASKFGWDMAIATVLFGFFVSALATLFSIGVGADLLQKRLDAASRRVVFGPLVDFWMAGRKSHFKIFIEVYYKDGRRSVGFDTMSALSQLTAVLTRIHGDSLHYEVIDANMLKSYSDLEHLDTNVILLGGDRSIPVTVEVLRRHNSRYKQECATSPRRIIRLAENQDNHIPYESNVSTDGMQQKFVKEYALVTRIPIDRGQSCWYLISGNHGVGTYLASLAISEPEKCPTLPGITEEPIQVMLIGENIIRSTIPNHNIDITCQRGWESLPKDRLW